MAREFGKRSYDPEWISFVASGNQPSGLPWSAVRRKIPVNILCEANNNPSTAEELSVALGISLPYMEEEVGLLVESELLKRLDDGRYITNFFIYPVECQNEIYEILCKYCEDNCERIWDLGKIAMNEAKRTACNNDAVSEDDAEMFFALRFYDIILTRAFGGYKEFKRRDGGNWGFCGFENDPVCRLDREFFNNNGTSMYEKVCWGGYQASGISERFPNKKYLEYSGVPESYSEVITMKFIADGADESKMSNTDLTNVKYLLDKGFVVRVDGKLKINAIVFNTPYNYANPDCLKDIYNTKAFAEELDAAKQMANKVYSIVEKYSNPYLKDDFDYYVSTMVFNTRAILAPLLKDRGLYTGSSAQFYALYIN